MNNDLSHPTGRLQMTNEQYHSAPGLSNSQLGAIGVSPLNYWDQHVNPNREPREYKHCFAVGDGTHKLVLEPGTFEQHYAVGFDKTAFPKALDTTDDLKNELKSMGLPVSGTKPELIKRLVEAGYTGQIMATLAQEHVKTMGDRIPMPANDYANMMKMLTAISSHHTAGGLIAGGEVEQSFFVVIDGILRKCRTDLITADGQFIVDLKTTDDVSKYGFGRTIFQRGYHIQAAFHLDVLHGLYGSDAPQLFALLAAQKTRPFDVAVHVLTAEQIQMGRVIYQRRIRRLLACMETGFWPGVDGGEVLVAETPEWITSREMQS